ncbi:hypothetical protein [Fluviispira multicolorata]|uniref:Uncharacterized protein n=1 Tax=Fluviispira multicolorata TaxID=2654512 RepID=A0A833JDJ6_9BACT|nr:hypothetical protein [Fluviispira multicolorata]KAB8031933.1 hypothetical protein GCL57_04615 [Fluviispira multicolorata]
MIANFIFHFIFAIFAVWAGVAWFILHNRYQSLRENLIPSLCLQNINITQNRSLFIRAIRTLEQELFHSFKIKFSIDINSFNTKKESHTLLLSLSSLINPKSLGQEIFFEYNHQILSANEFIKSITSQNKLKKIHISYKENTENSKFNWLVENINV